MPSITSVHTELVFENELTGHLATRGWSVRHHLFVPKGSNVAPDALARDYDRKLALLPSDLLAFVQQTQPKEWAKFKKWHNGSSEARFVQRVAQQLDKHGTLHVLRHGFKDVDARFKLAQFRPASGKNQGLWADYEANRLTVVRQLHYSRHHENNIDLVLFLNGIPVATAELKTDLTQSIRDAVQQYKTDRLPKDPKSREDEPLLQFKTRCLVHFAVSTDEVAMTTRLQGADTYFLPFNLGRPDGLGGASKGNPPAPKDKGYPTWYLWHQVWHRGVWLDVLGNFLHLESKVVEDRKGKRTTKESLIFPRYHQLEVVQLLVDAARTEGPGNVYLIQHSAGSGKSNSIAWTAHRLAQLHDDKDQKVFDSVIVITDRKVLDRQLQETISQFEHKAGVVQAIDENSQQLADALNTGVPVVVTTLQKFPYILEKVAALKERSFALIVDEAHSSQSGSAAQKLRKALTTDKPKAVVSVELNGQQVEVEADVEVDRDDQTGEDLINEAVEARKRPENVSYFAFTATPKGKTLELFGRPGADGKPQPFHVYSMRQAIDEGFILDVLKNYVSYKAFYKLASAGAASDAKELPKRKAAKALARYAVLHPYNIAQKVVVIVEHFRQHVAAKLGGRAKAMVVTDGRKAAVRYKLAMDKYLREQGYADMRTLVAFSGKVKDEESGPDDFTEANMNPDIKGVEPAEAFKEDQWRLLLVANKYQTGFDQPLLSAMYVDKRLSGVLAVQTLSRLNRTFPGKDSTFVLDFVNDPEEILDSFRPYYRAAQLEAVTDPNLVHELQTKLDKAGIYLWSEVQGYSGAFFDPKRTQGALHGFLKPAADRYRDAEDEEQEVFRKDLATFLRAYDFLSQIVPYGDTDLERLYVFGKNLLPRLAAGSSGSAVDLDDDVRLSHYRLQKLGEQQLDLESGEVAPLKAMSPGAGSAQEDERKRLADIVSKMNDLFGDKVSEADKVGYATTWCEKLTENEDLRVQATSNTMEQFAIGDFNRIATDAVVAAQEAHNRIAEHLLADTKALEQLLGMMSQAVWERLNSGRDMRRV